jgi:cytoskeletal protein RodZ
MDSLKNTNPTNYANYTNYANNANNATLPRLPGVQYPTHLRVNEPRRGSRIFKLAGGIFVIVAIVSLAVYASILAVRSSQRRTPLTTPTTPTQHTSSNASNASTASMRMSVAQTSSKSLAGERSDDYTDELQNALRRARYLRDRQDAAETASEPHDTTVLDRLEAELADRLKNDKERAVIKEALAAAMPRNP